MTHPRQPIFNVPAIVVATIGLLWAVHLVRERLLDRDAGIEFLILFAFIPMRYDPSVLAGGPVPGGWAADVWTFVTYAFLHADFMHLIVNTVWFLAFATPLARRFGTMRFVAFFIVTAAAGAFAHLLSHEGEIQPMVGASAVVSGAMAGALRFMFQPGGPLRRFGSASNDNHVPAVPLLGILRDVRIMTVIAAWFGINLIFGIGSLTVAGADQSVAWQAHVGGFIAGLLLFGLFDRVAAFPHSGNRTEP